MGSSHSKSVNIKICSESELLSLKGIGQSIAKRILDERVQRPFTSKEDFIDRIKGVGRYSWDRMHQQNEVNIVFGAQKAWFVEPPAWLTGKMNQRRRGKLILPQDPKFYRRGEWIVIDPQYKNLYPRTLWGIIQWNDIKRNGMLTVWTGEDQTQEINWKHCVIEQFLNKEMVNFRHGARNEAIRARTGEDMGLFPF